MSVFTIIANLGTILTILNSISAIVKEMHETKSAPSAGLVDQLILAIKSLVDKNVIKIPGLTAEQLDAILLALDSWLKSRSSK